MVVSLAAESKAVMRRMDSEVGSEGGEEGGMYSFGASAVSGLPDRGEGDDMVGELRVRWSMRVSCGRCPVPCVH